MNYQEFFATLMIIIAALIAVVNIITEVVKLTFNFKKTEYINFFVTILSIGLTVSVFLAYWQVKQLEITWYIILAFIIIGYMVAFGAMLGFDKLLKHFEKVKL